MNINDLDEYIISYVLGFVLDPCGITGFVCKRWRRIHRKYYREDGPYSLLSIDRDELLGMSYIGLLIHTFYIPFRILRAFSKNRLSSCGLSICKYVISSPIVCSCLKRGLIPAGFCGDILSPFWYSRDCDILMDFLVSGHYSCIVRECSIISFHYNVLLRKATRKHFPWLLMLSKEAETKGYVGSHNFVIDRLATEFVAPYHSQVCTYFIYHVHNPIESSIINYLTRLSYRKHFGGVPRAIIDFIEYLIENRHAFSPVTIHAIELFSSGGNMNPLEMLYDGGYTLSPYGKRLMRELHRK